MWRQECVGSWAKQAVVHSVAGCLITGLGMVEVLAQEGGDFEAGELKARACVACHGLRGEGKGGFPALAGQHAEYLGMTLRAYRDGGRPHLDMQNYAAGLDEEDIRDIAAYFATLPQRR